MTRFFIYGLLGLGFLALAAGWFLVGIWPVALALLLLAALILYLVKRNFTYLSVLTFALQTVAASVGLLRGVDLSLALVGFICALAAWDLDGFARRLAYAAPEDDRLRLERQHLLRLGFVLLLGLVISFVTLNIRVGFSFDLAIGLVLLTFVGIGALIGWLRRAES